MRGGAMSIERVPMIIGFRHGKALTYLVDSRAVEGDTVIAPSNYLRDATEGTVLARSSDYRGYMRVAEWVPPDD